MTVRKPDWSACHEPGRMAYHQARGALAMAAMVIVVAAGLSQQGWGRCPACRIHHNNSQLQGLVNELGRGESFGQNTTHMGEGTAR